MKIFDSFPEITHGTFMFDVSKWEGRGFVRMQQCHGRDVVVSPPSGPCDGMVTRERGVALMVVHADCQAALFYDPVKKVIAAVHAGWRGLVANIYGEAVRVMGSDPSNVFVGIAPSLGPCHAEFVNYQEEFPEEFWDFNVGNDHFDLWAIARMQLERCGIPKSQIEVTEVCTHDSPHFFSYRRDKKTGRHGTFIELKEHT